VWGAKTKKRCTNRTVRTLLKAFVFEIEEKNGWGGRIRKLSLHKKVKGFQ